MIQYEDITLDEKSFGKSKHLIERLHVWGVVSLLFDFDEILYKSSSYEC